MAIRIQKGVGTTESERYLAKLAERSFLNLWSYPNAYIDKKPKGSAIGKELCDLLVVCGEDILIFSDKTIAWPNVQDVELAWRRWSDRAIWKSFKQIRGAERWIDQFPDRIFLDPACTQPFPLDLPPKDRRRVHGIIVALGAGQACKEYFNEGSGSLAIMPQPLGCEELDQKMPFVIGDLDPAGSFVHVLDDATLDVVMKELDTITDLTSYLRKKEQFVRSGRLLGIHGEEDLVGLYLRRVNKDGEHDFVDDDGSPFDGFDAVAFEGIYDSLVVHPQYIAKKKADRASYVWDRLIELFTRHMMAGTTIAPDGRKFVLAEHEQTARHMALMPRYKRRLLAEGILGVLGQAPNHDRFVRGMIPGPGDPHPTTGFFFMTVKAEKFVRSGPYEQYRKIRSEMMYGYGLAMLHRYRNLERVIGVAMEPPVGSATPSGSSEDLMLLEAPAIWTSELLDQLAEYKDALDIMKEGRYREGTISGNEYPDPEKISVNRPSGTIQGRYREHPRSGNEHPDLAALLANRPPGMNRRERRALAAKQRKAGR